MRDLAVLRALEAVPREMFVPHRYADLASRDVALPIPCGQVMSEPYVVARMAEALSLTPDSRVLEIGAGSGYMSAILARLSSGVVSIERYQCLVGQARARLEALGIVNAAMVWGDGCAVPAEVGMFDRLIVHAAMASVPDCLIERMAPDAIMVYAQPGPSGSPLRQTLVRASRTLAGDWAMVRLCASRLRPLDPGVSRAL